MHTIYNNTIVATPTMPAADFGMIEIDPFESYATEYGMFIPGVAHMSLGFVEWIRSGMKEPMHELTVLDDMFVHIANDGRIHYIQVDTKSNMVMKLLISKSDFNITAAGQEYILGRYLLDGVTAITKAIEIITERTIHGIQKPMIITGQDWAEYAKSKGYTKQFSITRVRTP